MLHEYLPNNKKLPLKENSPGGIETSSLVRDFSRVQLQEYQRLLRVAQPMNTVEFQMIKQYSKLSLHKVHLCYHQHTKHAEYCGFKPASTTSSNDVDMRAIACLSALMFLSMYNLLPARVPYPQASCYSRYAPFQCCLWID